MTKNGCAEAAAGADGGGGGGRARRRGRGDSERAERGGRVSAAAGQQRAERARLRPQRARLRRLSRPARPCVVGGLSLRRAGLDPVHRRPRHHQRRPKVLQAVHRRHHPQIPFATECVSRGEGGGVPCRGCGDSANGRETGAGAERRRARRGDCVAGCAQPLPCGEDRCAQRRHCAAAVDADDRTQPCALRADRHSCDRHVPADGQQTHQRRGCRRRRRPRRCEHKQPRPQRLCQEPAPLDAAAAHQRVSGRGAQGHRRIGACHCVPRRRDACDGDGCDCKCERPPRLCPRRKGSLSCCASAGDHPHRHHEVHRLKKTHTPTAAPPPPPSFFSFTRPQHACFLHTQKERKKEREVDV